MTANAPIHAAYAKQTVATPSFMEKLSEWDSPSDPLASLTSEQKDSYLELASAAGNRPLPIELPLDEPVNLQHNVAAKGVHPAGSIEDVLSQGFSDMGMAQEKIQDVQQFYAWFSKVEERMSKLEAESYMDHVNTLKKYKGHCENIVGDVDQALTSLNELEKEYVFVSTKTNALHDACEQLLADQTKLINTAESIQHDLAFFNELDRITTRLQSPSLAVTGESFQALLTKIDECIHFMSTHASYKDSAEYLTKFKSCLSNALTMIKNYVVKSLNETTSNILNRKVSTLPASQQGGASMGIGTDDSGSSAAQEDAFTLYYGKFRTNAPRIKELVEQIEKRIESNEEYGNFLSEIHQCYFTQREQLVGPSVTTAMSDLLAMNKQDHCALVRSGCAFMVHVCEDEHQLYGHFFTMTSVKLDEMLRRLCLNLYDMLRPLIIHVYHLETLAELCTILKTDMIDDHVQNNPQQLHAFEFVAKQMLEDVQERLVFRANIHIRDDILGYKPAPGDLAYPEKLQMMEEIAQSLKDAAAKQGAERSFIEIKLDDEQEQAGTSTQLNTSMPSSEAQNMENSLRSGMQQQQQRFQTSPADMHGMWFPTVRRVLVCLSKLYRCIDKTVFQGLSQEALQACVQSLVHASQGIKNKEFTGQASNKSAKPKVIDGQLFLIKHLLILREQIAPFQAEFAVREMQLDFTRTKDAAYSMLDFGTLPKLLRVNSNNALMKFFVDGTPEVKEFYIDGKKDVDRQLKYVCEEFIDHVTHVLIGVLDDFLKKAMLVLNVAKEESGPKTSLRQQAFATPEHLKEVVSSAYRDLKLSSRSIHTSMSLYLANRDTENILFKPIKLNVQQAYQQLQLILLENYTEEDRAIIAAPTPEQVGITSLFTLAEVGNVNESQNFQLCLVIAGFIAMPCIASFLIMTAIAVDRYITVQKPFRDESSDAKKTAVIATFIWIFSFLIGFAPLMGWNHRWPVDSVQHCGLTTVAARSYILFLFFGLFLPLVIVSLCLYVIMCKISREQKRKITVVQPQERPSDNISSLHVVAEESADSGRSGNGSRATSIFTVCDSGISSAPASELAEGSSQPLPKTTRSSPVRTTSRRLPPDRRLRRRQSTRFTLAIESLKQEKGLRTIVLIMGCYVFMWAPLLITAVVQVFCGSACHLEDLDNTYLFVLGVANSAINPVVYISTDRRLKTHFCFCLFHPSGNAMVSTSAAYSSSDSISERTPRPGGN